MHDDLHRRSRYCRLAVALLTAAGLLPGVVGCNRAFYRRQADREVSRLIGCANAQTPTPLDNYNIWPSPASRMAELNNPDLPPMPPDDPTSHKLMRCVDHKRGWPYWRCYGTTPYVENPRWRNYLPYDAEGKVVLDRRKAFLLARLNSRAYQRELEDLYLSALTVTFQRFRLDSQFFGGNSTFFTADGPARMGSVGSELDVETSMEMKKLFATGGELVVGFANSLVWQFAGPDEYTAHTLLDFSLVQPLLRAGGRAVILEQLTQAERALLANTRQMERYRQAFYVETMAGRAAGPGPDPNNLLLSALSLPTTGIAGGILRILQEQVTIRNQRSNVTGLRESLDQLEAAYEAGRIDRFQVDLARSALYGAQNRLLTLRAAYEDRLDAYKLALGVPPQLDIHVDDPMLRQFDLIDPKTDAAEDAASKLLNDLRDPGKKPVAAEYLYQLSLVLQQSRDVQEMIRTDMERLKEALPQRRKDLRRLMTRPEFADGDVDAGAADTEALDRRVEALQADSTRLNEQMAKALDALAAIERAGGEPDLEAVIAQLNQLSKLLTELSLVQAGARLDAITLVPIEMAPDRAIDIARRYRYDWQNARAALVDVWRQIEVTANELQSGLDVTFSGDLNTNGNHPFAFNSNTGRLRVGMEFDAPLTRLAERNAYRQAIIDYERARRDYYAYEDGVAQRLRATLRTIRLAQLNFELQRAAIRVAIDQVAVTQLRLQRPPKPGEETTFGATTARDLVQALAGLLSAQNEFVSQWVDYEMQRMVLDLDLGTMQLDECGLWVDPGQIAEGSDKRTIAEEEGEAEELPLPPAVPLQDWFEKEQQQLERKK